MERQLASAIYRFGRRSRWPMLGLATLFLLRRMINRRAERNTIRCHYASRIEVAVKEREENIQWAREQSKEVNEQERKRIEEMDFIRLRDTLKSGEVTVETVIRVYYGLAVEAHERTNCLTNIVKRALDEAKAMDERAKEPTFTKPRLFGIPLSVKDSIELEGHRCTWGLAKLIDNFAREDSYQVAKLRQEGMIPFCQTNVPTTCLSYNCFNAVYALGHLLLHSPTRRARLAMPTEGPLAQDPHAIVEVMRALWNDHFISDNDPLSYYTTDGFIDPLPGNQRVVREAVEMLRAKGHKLVPFSLGDIPEEACKGVFATSTADGGALMTEKLKDEPLTPIMEPLRSFLSTPLWMKHIIGWIFKLRGDKNTADHFLGISDRAIDIKKIIDRVYACRTKVRWL